MGVLFSFLHVPFIGSHVHDVMNKVKARLMYKTLNKIGPYSVTHIFTYKDDITNYRVRNIKWCLFTNNHAPKA